MKNVTLSVDEEVLERARAVARRMGTSLNALIRSYLESLGGERDGDCTARELLELMDSQGGRSGGRRLRREDAYEGRL